MYVHAWLQADIEVTFSFPSLEKAEEFEQRWSNMDAQQLCAQKGSTVQGGLGPFGLLILASENLQEYTPVFFRVFKKHNHDFQHVVLMCSDASRLETYLKFITFYNHIYIYIYLIIYYLTVPHWRKDFTSHPLLAFLT